MRVESALTLQASTEQAALHREAGQDSAPCFRRPLEKASGRRTAAAHISRLRTTAINRKRLLEPRAPRMTFLAQGRSVQGGAVAGALCGKWWYGRGSRPGSGLHVVPYDAYGKYGVFWRHSRQLAKPMLPQRSPGAPGKRIPTMAAFAVAKKVC